MRASTTRYRGAAASPLRQRRVREQGRVSYHSSLHQGSRVLPSIASYEFR
jgi:hypothetical protein